MESLAAILNPEQLLTLRQDVFNNSPYAFVELATIETSEPLQDSLGISEEEASQVLSILEEIKNKRDIVLEHLGFDHETITSFRKDMETRRNEMLENLRTVLSNEQLEQLKEFRSRISQKRQGQIRGSFKKMRENNDEQ